MVKTVSVTGGTSGAVVAALTAGWTGVAVLIIVIVVPIAAICWVVADADRPQRLALLLSTWRHGTLAPPRRRGSAEATGSSEVIGKPAGTS